MSQLIISAAGAAVGFAVGGPTGAMWGWMAGNAVGMAFAPDQNISGPRLEDLTVSSSAYGAPIPYLQGTMRMSGQLIWASEKREIATTTEQGGKGGGGVSQTTYTYEVDLHFLLTDVEIYDVTRIWANGKLIYNKSNAAEGSSVDASDNTNAWTRMTVYTGAADQMPDPDGHPNAPAYRGRGSIFFKNYGLGMSGALPNLTFEVCTQGITTGSVWTTSSFGLRGVSGSNGGTVGFLSADDPATPEIEEATTYFEYAAVYNPLTDSFWVAAYSESQPDENNNRQVIEFSVFEKSRKTGATLSRISLGLQPTFNVPAWMVISPDYSKVYYLIVDHPYIFEIDTAAKTATEAFTIPFPDASTNFFWRLYLNHAGTRLVMPMQFIDPFGNDVTRLYIYDTATRVKIADVLVTSDTSQDAGGGTFSADDNFLFFCTESLWRIDMYSYAVVEAWQGDFTVFDEAGDLVFSPDNSKAYLGMQYDNRVLEFDVTTVTTYPSSVTLTFVEEYTCPVTASYMQLMAYDVDNEHIYIIDSDRGHSYRWNPTTNVWNALRQDETSCITSQPIPLIFGLSTATSPTLRQVVENLCARAGLTPEQYDASNLDSRSKIVNGMMSGQVTSVRVLLEQLATAYFFDCHLSDKLYFRHRGQDAVVTVPYTDMSASDKREGDHDPMPLTQVDELEIPAKLAVTYICPQRDYQTDTQYADRLVRTQDNTTTLQLPLSFSPNEAKEIADTLLLNKVLSALQVTISLSRKYYAFEPNDVLRLVDRDGSSYDMRMLSRKETDGILTFTAVKEDASVLVQSGEVAAVTDGSQVTVLPPAKTQMRVLTTLPTVLDPFADRIGVYVAVGSDATDWTGCTVYADNGSAPSIVGQYSIRAIMGKSLNTLADWTNGSVMDQSSTVDVLLTAADSLSSVTREALLKDPTLNLAVLGYEVFQFQTAELMAPKTYRLRNLLRYRNGSEFAMNYVAFTGSEFTLLQTNGGTQFLPQTLSALGTQQNWVAVSADQKYSDGTLVSFNNYGLYLRPIAPVHLHKEISQTDGAITIEWLRCTRVETRFVGPLVPSAPLAENAEVYEVEIYADLTYASIKRTVTASTNAVLYTSAQQISDFGALQTVLYVKVYQLSVTVGRGWPAQAKI